jgi:hypothetical protein
VHDTPIESARRTRDWPSGSQEEILPALLSLFILLGYWVSAITMPLYDGVFLGEGGVEPEPFGIPINVFWFNAMLMIQVISLFLVYRKREGAHFEE